MINFNSYSIIQNAGFLVSILTTVLLINILDTSDYGEYVFFATIIELGFVWMTFGFELSVNKFKKNNIRLKDLFYSILSIRFINSLLFFFLIFLFSLIYAVEYSIVVALIIVFIAALFNLNFIFFAEKSLTWIATGYFFSKVVFLVLCMVFLKENPSYELAILFFSASWLVSTLIYFIKGFSVFSFSKIDFSITIKIYKDTFSLSFLRFASFIEAFLILYKFLETVFLDNLMFYVKCLNKLVLFEVR